MLRFRGLLLARPVHSSREKLALAADIDSSAFASVGGAFRSRAFLLSIAVVPLVAPIFWPPFWQGGRRLGVLPLPLPWFLGLGWRNPALPVAGGVHIPL